MDKRNELLEKLKNAKNGIREFRNESLFQRITYIAPNDINITNYIRKSPLAVFNPAALKIEDKLYIFPRLIFDYYNYTSSIGMFSLNLEELMDEKIKTPIQTKIVLWPQHKWEFLGCEDARAHLFGDNIYLLYTGKGYFKSQDGKHRDVLALAQFDKNFKLKKKDFFHVRSKKGDFFPTSLKDSALLSQIGNGIFSSLIRPDFSGAQACWKAKMNVRKMEIDDLDVVITPEEWEEKVGWSTNAVRISKDEYLVGWHAVLKEDLSYRNGIAKVDRNGKLLSISDYLLFPTGINEEYGDRAQVIFGCGLFIHNDLIFWIGGVSDYAIGIFSASVSDVLSSLQDV